jgi:chemotaxis protein CheX
MIASAASDIDELTKTIWSTVLQMDLSVARVDSETIRRDGQHFLSACIHLSGEWSGAVVVDCPYDVARQFAAVMFDDENVGRADVADALGELANMVGGNLKARLEGVSQIGLPTVVDGTEYQLAVQGGECACRIKFTAEAGEFWISIMEKAGELVD